MENENIIYDININKIDDIIISILKNWYDFAVLEPNNIYCKVIYKKDSIVADSKNIKLNIYFNIVLEAKKISNLNLWETQIEQKNIWEHAIRDKKIQVLTKTVPWSFWESVFLKCSIIKENNNWNKNLKTNQKKKWISPWQAFWFLGWILLIALIMWWVFLTFIVNNAKTPSDVSFFKNLWINLNDVNVFLLNTTTLVFSIIILFLSLITIFVLYKAIFTKKEYKRKKIWFIIASIFFIIILLWTWVLWLALDKKIKSLPNWIEMSYWKIQIYDNNLLVNKDFWKQWSILTNTTNLIWPIDLAIDINYLKKDELQNWFLIKKYYFDFWDWTKEEFFSSDDSQSNIVIHTYDRKWTFNIKITLEWIDNRFPDKLNTKKEVLESPSISITNLVKITKTSIPDWWLKVNFDASDLKKIWETEWYTEKNLDKYISNNYYFSPQIIYKKEIIWLRVKEQTKKDKWWDRIFILDWEKTSTWWKIEYYQDIDNDLKYTFKVSDLDTSFWNWIITWFKWEIWDKVVQKNADLRDIKESSKAIITLDDYWDNDVILDITDSNGKTVRISEKIKTHKKIRLDNEVKFYYSKDDSKIENIKYYKNTWEYIINDLSAPETVRFDARFIRSANSLYSLQNISWDIWWDWSYEYKWRNIEHTFEKEWTTEVVVKYVLNHRKKTDEKIEMMEKVIVYTIQRDVIIDLKIEKASEYAPTTVSFDASLSKVKNDNIVKFIYDYWDWTPLEERDAKNPWHIYKEKWTYEVTLTIETEKWKRFSTKKFVILKWEVNIINITTSLKKAPAWQEINFSRAWSNWHIVEYMWNFWDWTESIESSPSHMFEKPWIYKVKLKAIFANNNIEEKEVEVEIY